MRQFRIDANNHVHPWEWETETERESDWTTEGLKHFPNRHGNLYHFPKINYSHWNNGVRCPFRVKKKKKQNQLTSASGLIFVYLSIWTHTHSHINAAMIIFNHKYWWLKCLKPKNAHRERIIRIVLDAHSDRIKTPTNNPGRDKEKEEKKPTKTVVLSIAHSVHYKLVFFFWGNSRLTRWRLSTLPCPVCIIVIINEGHQNSAPLTNTFIYIDGLTYWW